MQSYQFYGILFPVMRDNNKTIDEVSSILQGKQPQKRMRGAMAGLMNQGGVGSLGTMRRNGEFPAMICSKVRKGTMNLQDIKL